MEFSDVLILAVACVAVGLTTLLWLGVRRKVWTDEHPVMPVRANDDPSRTAYPG